jgi:hypothetical protein
MHAAPGRKRADAAPILARAILRKYQQYKFIGIGPFARAGPCLTLWRARPTSGKSEA